MSAQSTPSTQSTSTASPPFRPSTDPEIASNAALVLIAVACSLIDRQLKSQAESFLRHGGFTERLYQARTAARSRSRSEDRS